MNHDGHECPDQYGQAITVNGGTEPWEIAGFEFMSQPNWFRRSSMFGTF